MRSANVSTGTRSVAFNHGGSDTSLTEDYHGFMLCTCWGVGSHRQKGIIKVFILRWDATHR
jgi:hypothetical protein